MSLSLRFGSRHPPDPQQPRARGRCGAHAERPRPGILGAHSETMATPGPCPLPLRSARSTLGRPGLRLRPSPRSSTEPGWASSRRWSSRTDGPRGERQAGPQRHPSGDRALRSLRPVSSEERRSHEGRRAPASKWPMPRTREATGRPPRACPGSRQSRAHVVVF